MKSNTLFSALCLLLAVAVLGSCDRGTSTEPVIPVAGTYMLADVDGEPLPYIFIATELLRGDIIAGAMELDAEQRYLWTITVQWTIGTTPDEVQNFVRTGTYEQVGTEIRFTSEDGLVSTGTADGTRVMVQTEMEDVPNGLTYTFVRDTP